MSSWVVFDPVTIDLASLLLGVAAGLLFHEGLKRVGRQVLAAFGPRS